MSLIQLAPQVKRHDLIFQLPDAYMPELKRAEAQINLLARQEYARIKADFDAKAAELAQEKLELQQDMATIRDFVLIAMRLNLEWYADAIWLANESARQAVEVAKQDEAAKTAIWQQSTEAVLAENEALRAELASYKALLNEISRAKKPERVMSLVTKFKETL